MIFLKAKAMVLEEFGKKLQMREIEIPLLTKAQVLVKITASGVCGSDVHMFKGNDPRTPLPIILGHEGVGRVVEVKGKKLTVNREELKPGDNIIWNRGISCGECYFCKIKNNPALCPERWVYGISKSCKEKPYLNGCYADHIILSADTDIFKITDEIDPAILVPASCSGATAAHCFDYINPKVGDIVLIQGAGPLGIFATYLAAYNGAGQIIMIDVNEKRLEASKKFGATIALNRHIMNVEEIKKVVMDLTQGRGVDYAIEAVGKPSVVKEGLQLVRNGGVYLSVGFGEPNGSIEIGCFEDIVQKNLTYQGIWVSDVSNLYSAINCIFRDTELFSSLITHRFSLEKANEALKVMDNRQAVKAVLISN